MGQSLAIPRVIPNDWKRLDLIVNKIKMRLGRDSAPTFSNITITNIVTASTSVFSKTCTVAAGLNVLRVTGLQTDDTALTGTLRGAYIDVSNGSTEATGTIRALELKARTEAPDDTGSKVAVLEGLSISADSKAHDVTTMRAAEFILDGKTAGTIGEMVGLRIANNLQFDKATTSYGLQIYRDSFDYTYDISLSLGGHITGDSYVNQDLRTTANPTHVGLTLTGLTASSLIGTNASKLLESVTIGTGLAYIAPTLSLSHLGIEDLGDPGGDRILFWDDVGTAACEWLSVGPSIAITTTNLDTIQDIQTSASPTFAGLHINSAEVDSTTLLTLESDISNNNEYNEILFKITGGQNYGAIRSCVGVTAGDSYMSFFTTTDSGTLVRQVTIQHNGRVGFGTYNPETVLTIINAAPYLTLYNITEEDTDGGGESRLIYKREDGAGTGSACFQFEASHDGVVANDQLGKGIWSVNTGAGLVQALEIGSDLLATFAGAVSITGAVSAGSFTGLAIGTNVQAWDAQLDDIAALAVTNSSFIVGDGTNWVAESGATARTSIGLGTTNTPQFAKLGIGVAAPASGLLKVYNAAINTTVTYLGFYNYHQKITGVTDVSDDFYGIYNVAQYNQSGGVLGVGYGIRNVFRLTDGDIGDVSNARFLAAIHNVTDLDGGKVYGDVFGLEFLIDQGAANEVTGNIYGNYISIDADGTVGGSVYGLYLNEDSNVDYGIYQNGTAVNYFGGNIIINSGAIPSESQFEITANGLGNIALLNYAADNCGIFFDAYFDSGMKSADADSNFAVRKLSDKLKIIYDSAVAVGGAITWNDGFVMASDGGIFMPNIKSGTDQANAGAAANELYHDTDDNTIKIGV